MRDWEVDCQNRDVTDQHHRCASLHTGGGSTVAVCIPSVICLRFPFS